MLSASRPTLWTPLGAAAVLAVSAFSFAGCGSSGSGGPAAIATTPAQSPAAAAPSSPDVADGGLTLQRAART